VRVLGYRIRLSLKKYEFAFSNVLLLLLWDLCNFQLTLQQVFSQGANNIFLPLTSGNLTTLGAQLSPLSLKKLLA